MKKYANKDMSRAVLLIVAPLALLACMAAMKGSALTASAFDTVNTSIKTMLTSSWTYLMAIIVLVAAIWQLAHGGGYKTIGLVIGVFAMALVGPAFMTTMATSMPDATQMKGIQLYQVQMKQTSLIQK